MKVKKLFIKNYRGIENLVLDFHEDANIFIGVNGSGKSSVLDLMAILFSHSRVFSDGELLGIDSKSIRCDAEAIEATLECEAIDTTVNIDLFFSKNELRTKLNCSQPNHLETRRLEITERHDVGYEYPVVVYYPTNRAILDIPERIRGFSPQASQIEALEGALSHSLDYRSFIARFRECEHAVRDGDRQLSLFSYMPNYIGQHNAVQQSIREIISGFSDLHVQKNPFDIIIQKSGRSISFSQLSDGEKCFLAMVGDLAQRLAIANPLTDCPLKGEGVVLIDEVDLHLHPQWQRMILPRMMETFPNCQFIVSTHSPQILGEMRSEYVTILVEGENGIEARKPDYEIYGQTSDVILADIMDTPKRKKEIESKLKELFGAIDSGNLTEARRIKSELESEAKDIPEFARIELLMHRKEKLGK